MPALGVILGCRSTKGRLFLPSIPLHRGVLKGLSRYLRGLELYRRRQRNGRVTGRLNLTYEEALLSEEEEITGMTVLSTVSWTADKARAARHMVAWLGNDKEVARNGVVTWKDLISKKFPYSRNMLKSAPWVIHDRLAEKHEISRDLPKELKSKFFFYNSKTSGYHDSRKELDALMGLLNTKGERERGLLKQLAKFYCRICLGLQERSKDMIDKVALEETVLGTSTHVRATPREKPRKCLPPVH
ncbi:hypothetical protein MLD38_016273 [Melastoma candidum]|uniref:Uncharacterized protein n=1 Tax=Melastoma candidum TaxID=119954 RepID=A0ACB9RSD6_9MYRT|nr:hypothetical protein MLD38_016273 [Melastoma candidum]